MEYTEKLPISLSSSVTSHAYAHSHAFFQTYEAYVFFWFLQ